MFSLSSLAKIAGLGGIFVGCTGYTFRVLIQQQICQTEHYKDAISALRGDTEAMKLLGEPVQEKRINFTNGKDVGSKGNVNWFTVPVVGTQASGKLRYEVLQDERRNRKSGVFRIGLLVDNPSKETVVIRNEMEPHAVFE